MVKSSVLCSIVYLTVSNYLNGRFSPSFFFFFLFSFCISLGMPTKRRVCGRHSMPCKRMSLEMLTYGNDRNRLERKRGHGKVEGTGDG